MLITSSVAPKKIEFINVSSGSVLVVLRDGILEEVEVDPLTSTERKMYTYNEVRVPAKNRRGLSKQIEDNFNAWFEKGLKIEQQNKDRVEKERQIKKLIKEHEQIKVNRDLKEEVLISYDALTSLYMKNSELIFENDKLRQDNLTLMEAVTSLYEMIMSTT